MKLKQLKQFRLMALTVMTISLIGMGIAIYYNHIVTVIIALVIFVLALIIHLMLAVLKPFLMDKLLDEEALKNQGLTVVNCPECNKKNVLEDVYCIYCHAPLSDQSD
jgi:hypothetical protein